jgi:hypothetical protein
MGRRRSKPAIPQRVGAAIFTTLGVIATAIGLFSAYGAVTSDESPGSVEARVAAAQHELDVRRQEIAKLEAERERSRELARIDAEQAVAIGQALRSELEQEEKRSRLEQYWLVLAGAILGFVADRLPGLYMRWHRRVGRLPDDSRPRRS